MNKKIKNGLEMAAFTVPAIILVCLMMYVPFERLLLPDRMEWYFQGSEICRACEL